jgi:hypothetical protein
VPPGPSPAAAITHALMPPSTHLLMSCTDGLGRNLTAPLPIPCPPRRSAKTPLANFVTGIMVMFVLLFLTGVFTNMSSNVQVPPPQPLPAQPARRCRQQPWLAARPAARGGGLRDNAPALCMSCSAPCRVSAVCALTPACRPTMCVQGAIIIVGVMGLVDYPEFIYLWRVNKLDWLVWNFAFLFTIFLVSPAPAAARHCPAAGRACCLGGVLPVALHQACCLCRAQRRVAWGACAGPSFALPGVPGRSPPGMGMVEGRWETAPPPPHPTPPMPTHRTHVTLPRLPCRPSGRGDRHHCVRLRVAAAGHLQGRVGCVSCGWVWGGGGGGAGRLRAQLRWRNGCLLWRWAPLGG